MVHSGRALRPARTRNFCQAQQHLCLGTKRRLGVLTRMQLKAKYLGVKRDLAIKARDSQLDVAQPGRP